MYFSLYSVCTYKPIHYSSNYQISMVLLHLFINFPCLLSRCLQCENSNWIGFLFKWQACATTGVKPEPWSANILWIDEFLGWGSHRILSVKNGANAFLKSHLFFFLLQPIVCQLWESAVPSCAFFHIFPEYFIVACLGLQFDGNK